jgi:uroporphyrin-III C-methyltransferase / precorrin-2 dehydrogenase / sirohydrochlorin ferrochelatase
MRTQTLLPMRKPADAAASRMGPLAKLPVFLDLAGQRVIVAGGSAAAAWKAELLLVTGANVRVYANAIGEEMALLIERGAENGGITHHDRPWALDVFAGASLALADAESDAEARAFYCAAREAGVPVNVIDRPSFCQFQFGAIINRSPVVVAVSTDGAAPILGQAIRRRIETVLPPQLAQWATLAKSLRGPVMARLSKGPARRAFWEALSERAFRTVPTEQDREALDDLISDIASQAQTSGRVSLVGAGPGDAELLTLKAVRALQSADIVLYDDLVSDDVLELARREARRMMVGKRGGRESCNQDDINALMLKLARQGKHVVRLKAGDPMIFGRAGEEIRQLEAAGIAVEVVPGITAASAMAARLGISLTHRDCAQSVRFVTGHARDGGFPADLDWRGLADTKSTLIFYMGSRMAAAISERLVAEGLSPDTATVVVAGVSRADEQLWTGTLVELACGVQSVASPHPILIGIGVVFADLRSEAKLARSVSDAPKQTVGFATVC